MDRSPCGSFRSDQYLYVFYLGAVKPPQGFCFFWPQKKITFVTLVKVRIRRFAPRPHQNVSVAASSQNLRVVLAVGSALLLSRRFEIFA